MEVSEMKKEIREAELAISAILNKLSKSVECKDIDILITANIKLSGGVDVDCKLQVQY